jgi:hypothetical protein
MASPRRWGTCRGCPKLSSYLDSVGIFEMSPPWLEQYYSSALWRKELKCRVGRQWQWRDRMPDEGPWRVFDVGQLYFFVHQHQTPDQGVLPATAAHYQNLPTGLGDHPGV